ncbi:MAG: hypothetical protein KF781_08310 [Chitinophagaceae bacterium]|nr:hypothetical protein [Chitinophagaceae bacterium]MCW5905759.1 hypothetical protein [Chitinophagaceae bacterium]
MNKTLITFCCLLVTCLLKAQKIDLFEEAKKESAKADSNKTELTTATFKSTRLINGHSVETTKKGLLDFRISHRFGRLNQGLYELFGLDNATMRMGMDYGITDKLTIGIGRSTFQKQLDGFMKYKLLAQAKGKNNFPVTVTWVSGIMIKTIRETDPAQKRTTAEKTSYVHQVMIARKLNEKTSLQIMPTLVHYNLVPLENDPNDLFSLGFGGRYKISKRVSINAEYYWQLNKFKGYYNSFAIGVDIETGGHVFQLHFTNSTGMTERSFIHETTGYWTKGDIHFGFNISRVFKIKKQAIND